MLTMAVVISLVERDGLLSDLKVCSHHRHNYRVLLSSDIGVVIQWIDDKMYFFIVLRLPESKKKNFILYNEFYTLNSSVG